MNWDDTGFLLSKNQYNENSIIAEIFTENHGKISGIIFGASSKKIKNYLQIGNKLYVNHIFKSDGRIGYFKVEILEPLTPLYFNNKKKLMCITSAMNLIKLLTAESQKNSNIYNLIEDFYNFLQFNNWIKSYIFWELELLKLLGYDLDLKKIVKTETINNKVSYFVENTIEKKIVPNFLIDDESSYLDNNNLLKGLKLVGDYLEKTILKPNNLKLPISRLDFVNVLK